MRFISDFEIVKGTYGTPTIIIYDDNGNSRYVDWDQYSGRIIERMKIDTRHRIKHPGIIIGRDFQTRQLLVVHNHIDAGGAFIDTYSGFTKGTRTWFSVRECTNTRLRAVEIALEHVISRDFYRPFSYNCQTLESRACDNSSYSYDGSRILGNILGVGLGVAFVYAIAQTGR